MWDSATGNLIRTFQHADNVHAVSFSPDGKQILTGSTERTAKLWDLVEHFFTNRNLNQSELLHALRATFRRMSGYRSLLIALNCGDGFFIFVTTLVEHYQCTSFISVLFIRSLYPLSERLIRVFVQKKKRSNAVLNNDENKIWL